MRWKPNSKRWGGTADHDFRHHHRRLRPYFVRPDHRSVLQFAAPRQAADLRPELRPGPDELRQYVAELARISETYVTAHPNAGLPNAFGEYDLDAAEMARRVGEWAQAGFLNIIGGCCGTTPEHIAAMANAVEACRRAGCRRSRSPAARRASEPLTIDANTLFVNVGERTNVTGSARFKRLIKEEKYSEALDVARQQVESGAQIIDINMDEGMLDAEAAMVRFLNLIAGEPDIARVPIMIDSSVVRYRERPEVHSGQGHRQLDLDEGG